MKMKKIINKTTLSQLNPIFFAQVESWLKENKINYNSSRFGQAAAYYKSWMDTGVIPPFRDLWSISELIDLFDFYKSFHDAENFDSKFLRRISKGNVILEQDNKKSARDLAFELKVASRFKRAGFSILENDDHDVVIVKNNIVLSMECKRPRTQNTLIKNIRYAFDKQLNKENLKNSIICVDLSHIIYESQKIGFDNGDVVHPVINSARLAAYRDHLDRTFKDYISSESPDICKAIRMVIFYYSFPILLDEESTPENVKFVKFNHFVTIKNDDDEINDLISKSLNDSVGKLFGDNISS